jgi:thiamine-monophosphate kinase
VFVTGALGRSAVGLRRLRAAAEGGTPADPSDPAVRAHRRPAALVREGGAARMAGATAMIDVSDGLAADLDQLATASGVGLRLDAIPVAPGATTAEALGGGEDYVLAFCAPDEGGVRAAFAERGLDQPVRVGTCTSEPALRSLGDGPLPTTGYEHGWE